MEPWRRRGNEPAIKAETLAAALFLTRSSWLTEGSADTSEMAQFRIGGNSVLAFGGEIEVAVVGGGDHGGTLHAAPIVAAMAES